MPMSRDFLVRSRHKSIWYVRIIVPKILRSTVGKSEIRISTRTSAKKQAKVIALKCYVHYQELFQDVIMSKKYDSDEIPENADGYIMFFDSMGRKHEVDFGNVPDAAEKELEAVRKLKEKSAEELILLAEKFKDTPKILKLILNSQSDRPNGRSKLSFADLTESYKEYRKTQVKVPGRGGSISSTTQKEEVGRIDFWKHVFSNKTIGEISHKEIKSALEWLNYLPAIHHTGLSFSEAIQLSKENAKTHTQPAVPSTFNKWASVLSQILSYAFDKSHTELDLSASVKLKPIDANKEVMSFTSDDLLKMFSADYGMYFGNASKRLSLEAKFWIPLFGLFTGCRIEEIAQLKVSDVDVDEESGIEFFSIRNDQLGPDGKLQSTKNRSSIRPVPIHSTLLTIGFLDYLKELKSEPGKSLFRLPMASNQKYGKEFSKYFSRKPTSNSTSQGYIERVGIESKVTKDDGTFQSKSFHSFRHTVATRLSKEFGNSSQFGYVLGHKETGETAAYITHGPKDRLAVSKEIIEKISFSELDFSSIQWGKFKKAHSL